MHELARNKNNSPEEKSVCAWAVTEIKIQLDFMFLVVRVPHKEDKNKITQWNTNTSAKIDNGKVNK